MASRVLTPKQRGELSRARKQAKTELTNRVLNNKDTRQYILSKSDYIDQLRFNRVSKQWCMTLKNERSSVFYVLHCLYHTMSFACPDTCYNPLTGETIEGSPGTEYRRPYYVLEKLRELDETYYPARREYVR